MAIYRLMNHGVIAKLQHPVKQGKESLVLHALAPDGREAAVKVHTSRVFREHERKQYLFGDWRLRHAKRHITQRTEAIGAEKEFRNLHRLEKSRSSSTSPSLFLRKHCRHELHRKKRRSGLVSENDKTSRAREHRRKNSTSHQRSSA